MSSTPKSGKDASSKDSADIWWHITLLYMRCLTWLTPIMIKRLLSLSYRTASSDSVISTWLNLNLRFSCAESFLKITQLRTLHKKNSYPVSGVLTLMMSLSMKERKKNSLDNKNKHAKMLESTMMMKTMTTLRCPLFLSLNFLLITLLWLDRELSVISITNCRILRYSELSKGRSSLKWLLLKPSRSWTNSM